MKRVSIFLAMVAWSLSTMVVLATPGSNVAVTPIARAAFAGAIDSDQDAGLQSVIQQLTIAPTSGTSPGGHTGWHTHPGGTVVLVQSGTFSFYNDACVETEVTAGNGVFEVGGHTQLARNEGTEPLVLTVVYFDVPVGGAVRSDATAPACAGVGNDLPTTASGSGITFPAGTTGGIIQRATFASAANIDQAASRDVFVQHQTYPTGAHSGWHSHPGATVVYVESGELSLYLSDCQEMTVGAGQGVVEPPNTTMLARNEGTAPVVLRVAYFDVPIQGAFRIDQPEPSTCTGLAAVPTAAPTTVPDTAAASGGEPVVLWPLAAIALAASLGGLAVLASRGRARR